jgi:hypothetical protein
MNCSLNFLCAQIGQHHPDNLALCSPLVRVHYLSRSPGLSVTELLVRHTHRQQISQLGTTKIGRLIYLYTYMHCGVYEESGLCFRNHCGAKPPRDIEPLGLVTTVGGRDRASTSYVAADRVKAPAGAARGWFRGIHGGRTAPSLPAETRTTSGGGCLAGSVPSVLVRSRGCFGAPPRPHGSIDTGEKSGHTNEESGNTNEKEC